MGDDFIKDLINDKQADIKILKGRNFADKIDDIKGKETIKDIKETIKETIKELIIKIIIL